jgi:hypothetical protein
MYETETLNEVVDVANESRVRPLFPVKGADPRAAVSNGFTYRHAWPEKRKGIFNARLNNFFGIKPDWNVFVSAGEAVVLSDATAGSFIGDARYTVNNVSPGDNFIIIRLTIDSKDGGPWGGNALAFITDYVVVPF